MALSSVLRIWLSATRPRTLPAALAPVIVGSAFAWRLDRFSLAAASACLAFALLIQIATNFANDYFDYLKGADTVDRVGPRRAVASGLVAPRVMRNAMIGTFLAAFIVGLLLLPFGGWPLLVIGAMSILCGVAYTGGPYPLGYNGLGDVFVFLFFGLVAVCTTFYVQAGFPPMDVWLAAIAIGCLAANILVANNYRDAETDAKAGKRTTVVRFGKRFARMQFTFAHLVSLMIPMVLLIRGHSAWVLISWILLPLAFRQVRSLGNARSAPELITLLGATGKYLALYAVALSLGVMLGT